MTREGAGAEDYSDRLRVHILNRISQRFGGTVKAAATEIVQSFDMLIPLYIRAAEAAATAKERERCASVAENVKGGYTANIRTSPDEQELVRDPDGPWVLNGDIAKAIRGDEQDGAPQGKIRSHVFTHGPVVTSPACWHVTRCGQPPEAHEAHE